MHIWPHSLQGYLGDHPQAEYFGLGALDGSISEWRLCNPQEAHQRGHSTV